MKQFVLALIDELYDFNLFFVANNIKTIFEQEKRLFIKRWTRRQRRDEYCQFEKHDK